MVSPQSEAYIREYLITSVNQEAEHQFPYRVQLSYIWALQTINEPTYPLAGRFILAPAYPANAYMVEIVLSAESLQYLPSHRTDDQGPPDLLVTDLRHKLNAVFE